MTVYLPARFDTSLTYYVSGPMTGIPEFNHPVFAAACAKFRLGGMTVISPHELPAPEDKSGDSLWNHMMLLCHEQIELCQGTIFLPGWLYSRGSRRELLWGLTLQHRFFFYDGINQITDMNRRALDGEENDHPERLQADAH